MVSLEPDDGRAFVARARAAMWLGRYDDARRDLSAALTVAKAHPDEALSRDVTAATDELNLWSTPSAAPSPGKVCETADAGHTYSIDHLIGDCSLAFLNAVTGADKAKFLTIRSLTWLAAHHNRWAMTDDAEVAVGLDPDNPDWRSNLGCDYLQENQVSAAVRQFDRSIALKRSFIALAGRSAAKYQLNDFRGASADAKASFEIRPNEAALTALGDLSLEQRHDPKSAKLYWMGAYHLGDRDDGLIVRLKKIGVEHPDNETVTQSATP